MLITSAMGAIDAARKTSRRQCGHGSRLGRIAEENPDLPLEFIRGVLEARREMENGETTPFDFRDA